MLLGIKTLENHCQIRKKATQRLRDCKVFICKAARACSRLSDIVCELCTSTNSCVELTLESHVNIVIKCVHSVHQE